MASISAKVTVPGKRRNANRYKADVQKALNRFLVNSLNELRDYPPPPPTSKYRRTHHLRDSWRPSKTATTARLTNDAEYSPYVQGDYQAATHAATGWPTLDEVVDRNEEVLREEVEEAAKRAID